MKRLPIFLLSLLLITLPSLAPALTTDEIDWRVDDLFRNSHTIGGALAVIVDDQIVYQYYYGNQDEALEIPVTANTYFRVASVTKMVSGIGLMQLREQGLVDLDEDISTYFGYSIANPDYPGTPITLRQLMSHTSSLSTNGGYGDYRSIHNMLAKELKHRSNFYDAAPGSKYEYSNFGAGVVGAIIESVTGMSVNQYMTEHVFQPLSLDASYDPSRLSDPDKFLPNLYEKNGKRYRSVAYMLQEEYEDFADPENHYRTTVGSLWIRATDLAKLTIALCGNGSADGVRLLSEESISQMRDDQTTYGTSVTGESPYGLFLMRDNTLIQGHTFYGHQGVFQGVLCNVYFEPESRFGLVMLTNGCNNVLQNHIGVLSRRMLTFAYPIFVGEEEYQPYLVQ